jgi:carboxymethylenebutenolidase
MSKNVEIGAGVTGAVAEPEGFTTAGGVVIVQEWFGINDDMKKMVDRFAAAGFVAVAPDLYHGKIARSEDEASQMMNALDFGKAASEVGQAVEYLKTNARCNDKVAVLGFCMGGALAFVAACSVPGLAAVVAFYGAPDIDKLDLRRVTAPIQAHFAKRDEWAAPSKAEAIKKQLDALGKPMELHVYDAGHAFMRDSDPAKHDAPSARLAWERATAFLKKHLA